MLLEKSGEIAPERMKKERKMKSLSHVRLCDHMEPARLLSPWDFPGKSTEVGCHFLLQGIFPTLVLNQGLLHCRQTLYRLSHENRDKRKNEEADPKANTTPRYGCDW